jgi:hypothetical protein
VDQERQAWLHGRLASLPHAEHGALEAGSKHLLHHAREIPSHYQQDAV